MEDGTKNQIPKIVETAVEDFLEIAELSGFSREEAIQEIIGGIRDAIFYRVMPPQDHRRYPAYFLAWDLTRDCKTITGLKKIAPVMGLARRHVRA